MGGAQKRRLDGAVQRGSWPGAEQSSQQSAQRAGGSATSRRQGPPLRAHRPATGRSAGRRRRPRRRATGRAAVSRLHAHTSTGERQRRGAAAAAPALLQRTATCRGRHLDLDLRNGRAAAPPRLLARARWRSKGGKNGVREALHGQWRGQWAPSLGGATARLPRASIRSESTVRVATVRVRVEY